MIMWKTLQHYFPGELRALYKTLALRNNQLFANEYRGLWRISKKSRCGCQVFFIETKYKYQPVRKIDAREYIIVDDVVYQRREQSVFDINTIFIFSHNYILLAEVYEGGQIGEKFDLVDSYIAKIVRDTSRDTLQSSPKCTIECSGAFFAHYFGNEKLDWKKFHHLVMCSNIIFEIMAGELILRTYQYKRYWPCYSDKNAFPYKITFMNRNYPGQPASIDFGEKIIVQYD